MPEAGRELPPDPEAQVDAGSGRCQRPWGWFETLADGESYRVKRLLVLAHQRISLQRHRHRCEHWVVVAGNGRLELEGESIPARPGVTLFIPVGAMHRLTAGSSDLVLIEVQRGDRLEESDIERWQDDYGRAVSST